MRLLKHYGANLGQCVWYTERLYESLLIRMVDIIQIKSWVPNALMIHFSWCDMYEASDKEYKDPLSPESRVLGEWYKQNSWRGVLTCKLSGLWDIWLVVSKS